jgi:hypothetical protein
MLKKYIRFTWYVQSECQFHWWKCCHWVDAEQKRLYPDVAIVVTDVENLKRNLLLFTQIKDLEIPTILVINMADRMEYKGITLDIPYLETKTKIALISSRKELVLMN